MKKTIAAFFDIDGTLYREGMITETFKKLIKYEIIEEEKWYSVVKPYYDKWDKRVGNYDHYLIKMATIYIDAIKGLHESQVEFIAKRVIEQNGDRVYTFTRDSIAYHKKMGHKVIAISGSPYELVKQMASKYDFDDFIGTIYHKNQENYYTGDLSPMWDSVNKMEALAKFVEDYQIDLEKSFAYGDTNGDFSMLSAVGNPTVMNPTKEVLKAILADPKMKEKIRIVVERKDMVYGLSPDHFEIL